MLQCWRSIKQLMGDQKENRVCLGNGFVFVYCRDALGWFFQSFYATLLDSFCHFHLTHMLKPFDVCTMHTIATIFYGQTRRRKNKLSLPIDVCLHLLSSTIVVTHMVNKKTYRKYLNVYVRFDDWNQRERYCTVELRSLSCIRSRLGWLGVYALETGLSKYDAILRTRPSSIDWSVCAYNERAFGYMVVPSNVSMQQVFLTILFYSFREEYLGGIFKQFIIQN